jgi:hypothetical protein
MGIMVAGTASYKLFVENHSFPDWGVWGPVFGFVFFAPATFLIPLFMFSKQLLVEKMSALEFYSSMAASYMIRNRLQDEPADNLQYVTTRLQIVYENYNKVRTYESCPF